MLMIMLKIIPQIKQKITQKSLQQRGFTLIELLVAIAIVGILSAIAYPAYQQHVLRTYRAEASQLLLTVANTQEQQLADYGRYTDDLVELGMAADGVSASGRYRLHVSLSDSSSFVLEARAQGAQSADLDCLVFTLDHTGERNASRPDSLFCWH